MVESPNRWEKTIGLHRTASGVDISDGISAATVLEHSPPGADGGRSDRAVSGFSFGKDSKGKSKDGKGKGKGKKGEKSKDLKPIVKTEQFQGYCAYCEKW